MVMTKLVQPYDPRWPLDFACIRDLLEASLGNTIVAVEHVGSTSIPGMSAKPVIDF